MNYRKINLSILKDNYFLVLLFFQLLFFFTIFGPLNILSYDLNPYIDNYDGPSYYNFKFDNLKIILSQHRTFGFPLIMKLYRVFDFNLIYWAHYNFIIYASSIILLYFSLKQINSNENFLFVFCLGLVVSNSLYAYIGQYTELISISFVLISISLSLFAIKRQKVKYYILFSIFMFFSYQIRPSMVVFILFPLIFSFFYKIFLNKNFRIIYLFFSTLSPLAIFLILRLIIVNDFGLVSFNGGMAGNAIHYLETTEEKSLKQNNQNLAKIFLERKKKLPYPCNLDNYQEKVEYYKKKHKKLYGQYPCWNEYFMSTWLDVIKLKKNLEPFSENDLRNDVPWLHYKTLASFWTEVGDNVEVDKTIKDFSKDVYNQNKFSIIKKIAKSPIYFFKFQRDKNINLIIFYIILMFIIFIFGKNTKYENKKISLELIFLFSFILITFLNLLLLYGHQNGNIRAVLIQTFYFIPICMSYLIYLIKINSKFSFFL